jgi:hypothetical protein
MKTHELKCWTEYFQAVFMREKNFEIRLNDRDYEVGDVLILREYHPKHGYTGRVTQRKVTYILHYSPFVKDGYVVMSLA